MTDQHDTLTPEEREQRSVEAIRHLSFEIAELVDLRGRLAQARALAVQTGQADIVNALDGHPAPQVPRPGQETR